MPFKRKELLIMKVRHEKPKIKEELKHGLKYVLVQTRTKLSEGMACYSARVRHNEKLDERQIVSELEGRCKVSGSLAEYIVKSIDAIIVENLQRGNQVTFGGFTIGLSIRGGFDAANDTFDPKRNAVEVVVSPRNDLKDATAYIRPENVTDTVNPKFEGVVTEDANPGEQNRLRCGVRCLANGSDFAGSDEGDPKVDRLWLETVEGKFAAEAEILSLDATRLDFKVDANLVPGSYWLMARRKNADGRSSALARQKVEIVAAR